jgi:hypothetical protein
LSRAQKRDVTDALPERLRVPIQSAINQAYASVTPAVPGACSKISRVGLNISIRAPPPRSADETLTVMRLGLPENPEAAFFIRHQIHKFR